MIDADQTVARKAGQISGGSFDRGERIDQEDCVIAATALLEDEPVLTRNVDRFERVDGLEIRTY